MLLPYASEEGLLQGGNNDRVRPYATLLLLVITLAVAVWMEISMQMGSGDRVERVLEWFALVPARPLVHPWAFLTYVFLHVGFAHLLINAFYLWVFGGGVEAAVGWKKFLALYLAGGAFGGALQCLVVRTLLVDIADLPVVGASAACACLIGVYAVRYYRARLYFAPVPLRLHVVVVVGLFLLYEIGSGLWGVATGAMADGIAHWAHTGGFLFGLIYAQVARLDAAGQSAYLQAEATRASVPGAAIRRWEALLAREPGNPTAHAELARAWLQLGDTEHAANHYLHAINAHLRNNQRAEAALLYVEMREQLPRAPSPSSNQLYQLGCALEELEQFALAAETLRAVTVRSPGAPEAEVALLKVIGLYVHRLGRREEAAILLRLFRERYPHSVWLPVAGELDRAISTTSRAADTTDSSATVRE
ncbi:MAG: rhomboid family intramembrane serine protease [Chloroherpetonaceae bacterium]|nr:rhomboid family intramembrane serine protease [Chthonomonadaceae bacterium]MDW8208775.1 rhomboid family intramembrane serine protease [Chloroherpetonaceae bacterium]